MVLLNGPVKNALFCLMDRYRNVCVWFMARNCRFPKVGTHCCQRGNHMLPLQGTAGSQRLELLVPNLGTMGYHCKILQATAGYQRLELMLPNLGTIGYHCKILQATAGYQRLELMLPNLGTIGYHCKKLPVPKGWN